MIVDGNLGNHGNVGNDGICSMPFFKVLETLVYIHFFSSKKTPHPKDENTPFIERSSNSRQLGLLPSLPSLPLIFNKPSTSLSTTIKQPDALFLINLENTPKLKEARRRLEILGTAIGFIEGLKWV